MAIEATCPGCGNQSEVPPSYQGKRVRCPDCETPFQIPRQNTEKPALTPTPVERPKKQSEQALTSTPVEPTPKQEALTPIPVESPKSTSEDALKPTIVSEPKSERRIRSSQKSDHSSRNLSQDGPHSSISPRRSAPHDDYDQEDRPYRRYNSSNAMGVWIGVGSIIIGLLVVIIILLLNDKSEDAGTVAEENGNNKQVEKPSHKKPDKDQLLPDNAKVPDKIETKPPVVNNDNGKGGNEEKTDPVDVPPKNPGDGSPPLKKPPMSNEPGGNPPNKPPMNGNPNPPPPKGGKQKMGLIPLDIGGTFTLRLKIARPSFVGPVKVSLMNLPKGVTAPTVTVPADQDMGEIKLSAARTAEGQIATITLAIQASNGRQEQKLELSVRQPRFVGNNPNPNPMPNPNNPNPNPNPKPKPPAMKGVVAMKPVLTFDKHEGLIRSVAISKNGQYVLSAGKDMVVRLWDIKTGKELRTFAGHTGMIYDAKFMPGEKSIVSAGEDKTLRLWDIKTGKEIRQLTRQRTPQDPPNALLDGWYLSVEPSPDGRILYASDSEGVRVFDLKSGRQFTSVYPFCYDLTAHPGGKMLAMACPKGLLLWNLSVNQQPVSPRIRIGSADCVSWSSDGSKVLSLSTGPYLALWDTRTGNQIKVLTGYAGGGLTSARLDTKDRFVAVGGATGSLQLLDLNTDKVYAQGEGHTGAIKEIAVSTDGKLLVTGSFDGTVRVWEVPQQNQAAVNLP